MTEVPFPPDVNISSCANWTKNSISSGNLRGPSTSSVTFELPLSSEKLFLLSRGAAAGMVAVVSTNESMDNARVQIVASYRHSKDLGGAQVCSINRGDKERGVGIFTRPWPKRDYVHYTIIVYLPANSKTQPLRIKNFETDLPLFSHSISQLADVVHFDTLSLTTSMMPINVASLSATKALVKTSHAKIEGTFNTSSALELSTFNAPIKVNVGLLNKNTPDKTKLSMNTNRGPITATISLVSTTKTRGQFNVSATTSLDALALTFTEAPVDSILSLNARSSFAPVTVKLHETYEGAINVVTSLSRAEIVVDESVEDPAGRRRMRAFNVWRMGKSHIQASVTWMPGTKLGSVNVETSMESATIKL
ncbi:hypothetical protein BDZ94DRAFT_532508 [Collybia nuda]|uniref:Uncharacterized protein n=1 Tax=Collybia nuda TaxID=64659 RepID=A0A9P5Y8B7_9AGAR|nr:hypothetical protein BDZ94DRAFT_532508 [Collybia nuda]